MAKKITNKLAHLPQEITIDRMEEHPHTLELFISFPAPEIRACPRCGSNDCVIKDSGRVQTVRHVTCSSTGVLLTFHKRRLKCKDCSSSFYEQPYWLHPSSRITLALYSDICRGLMTTHSIRDIALQNGVTESIVTNVLKSVDFSHPDQLPHTLCIDEFKGSSGEWEPTKRRWDINKYHCNISDGDTGCIVDILPAIDLASLTEYFYGYSIDVRRRVRFFACDMHGGFISLAKRCFPNVTVCIDMFHVVRLLNENVTSIRRILQNELRDNGDEEAYQLLKNSARLLTTSERNKDRYWGSRYDVKAERLEQILALSDDLREAYDALQDFHCILVEPMYSIQRADLTDWIRKYSASENPDTRRCANTIRHHRTYIQNSWKYKKSNATAEGLNDRIKVLKRNGYGAHSFENFRKRILFSCGYTKFVEETYTIAAEKHAGKEA